MEPIRFGIVGCGGLSHLYVDCLKRLDSEGLAKLIAGADVDPDRAAKWGEKHSLPVHESLGQLLTRTDIDAVIVTTPSGWHGEQCVQIAKTGRHILCEKPLDVDLTAADTAMAAARQHKVVLGGIFQQRFAASAQQVKRAISQGYFGQIVLVHCETPWFRSQEYYDSADWRGTWAMDGGVLTNQACHMIDRLLWLAGDLEEVTSSVLPCGFQRKIEAETVAVVTVRLKGGALGTITGTTLAYDGLPQRVLICGTEGSAAFENDTLTYFKTARPFESAAESDSPAEAPASPAEGNRASTPLALIAENHLANIRDFVVALRENRAPSVTAEDSRRVVRALNMIYAKAKVGPWRPSK